MWAELPGRLLWVPALSPVAQAIGFWTGAAFLAPADD